MADEFVPAPQLQAIYEQYAVAAGHAALVELKLRLLASRTPGLERAAVKQHLEDVEEKLAAAYPNYIPDESLDLLKKSRGLRNKLLHADFEHAKRKLSDLGGGPRDGGVRRIDLGDARDASSIIERIAEGLAGGGTPVSSTNSTVEGTIFGWLLETAQSGVLVDSISVFKQVEQFIDHVIDASAREETQR